MRPDSRFPYALRRRSALLLCTLLATFASVLTAGCKDVPPAARVVAAASAGFDAGVPYPTSAVYDPRANVLLIGSYADGSIQRVSAMEDAPRARLAGLPLDGRQHVLRIRIDATRHRIWVLSSDGLYLYDGESLKLTHRVATEALSQHSSEHCLPDMALDRSGNVYVSSAMEPRYMRVDAESLDVRQHVVQVDSEQGKDFGFSAMRFAGEDDTLYAASATIGTLWKIDPRKNHATKIALTQPIWGACALHAAPTGENGSGSRAPIAFYVAGGFRDGVTRVEVSGSHLPSQVTVVKAARTLSVPTDFVSVGRNTMAVVSRLSEHPDFNGDWQSNAAFAIVSLRTP